MIHRRILSPLRAPFLSLALALASAGSLAAPAQPAGAQAEGPRAGTAVAIGGALKLDNAVVWRRLVQEAGGPGARFAVFATASENPERNGARLVGALNAAGARAEFIGVAPRLSGSDAAQAQQLAADPQLAARVAAMQGVFFSGGAQELITATLAPQGRESALLAAVRQVLARGGVVAGTSAGAAIMSEWMFRDAQDALAVLKGRLRDGMEVERGLGFAGPGLFIDQHFLKRGRIARLLPVMVAKGYQLGLGVEEDSAAFLRDGRVEVLGARGALFVDLREAQVGAPGQPFRLRGARLSFLDRGDRLDLRSLVVTPSREKREGRAVLPQSPDFKPFFKRAGFFADMLGDNTLVTAMAQLLDSPDTELRGLAFNGRALLGEPALAADGGPDPDPTLGFEFRLYKDARTQGQYTGAWGAEDYSVQDMRLDVIPVRMHRPLYEALPENEKKER